MKRVVSLLATLLWVAFCFPAFAADNVTVSNGPSSNNSDYVTATDEVGGINYQKVKCIDPTADSTAAIGVAANPWRTDPTGTTTQPVSGTVTANQGGAWTAACTQSGSWNINNIAGSVSLPTGASTSALQTTGNSSLSSIDGKTPALVNGRVPTDTVVGAATAQTNTITGLSQSRSIALSGAQKVVLEYSGTYTAIQLQFEASYDGGSSYVSIYGFSKNLGIYAYQSPIDSNQRRIWVFNTIGATHFQVRSSSYTSGTENIRFIPVALGDTVSAVEVINAVSASITSASYAGADGNAPPSDGVQIAGWDTINSELHFLTALNGAPGASDYGLIVRGAGTFAATQSGSWTNACTQSGTWNINNVSGTVSLPTGAATASLQTTGNSSLSSIDGKLPALVSGRIPVESTGNIAHGATDSGNPIKIGGKARTADPTPVSDGQRVDALLDKLGRFITGIGCLQENQFSGMTAADITTTTSTQVVAAGGAGVKYAVHCISVSNMNSTVATRVDLQDGTTAKFPCSAAAGGGGCFGCSAIPFFIGTANTALQAQAGTAGANVRVGMSGCKVP